MKNRNRDKDIAVLLTFLAIAVTWAFFNFSALNSKSSSTEDQLRQTVEKNYTSFGTVIAIATSNASSGYNYSSLHEAEQTATALPKH